MAVKPEKIKFKNGFSTNGKVFRRVTSTQIEGLERAANGAWFATVSVSVTCDLIDGRRIVIDRKVRLRGAQEGKRPHPDPFGHKKNRKLMRKAKLIG